MFCPILHILSLAFADNAFDSDDIQSVQDIYNHTIPDFKECAHLYVSRVSTFLSMYLH